jgi:hypothetical protein
MLFVGNFRKNGDEIAKYTRQELAKFAEMLEMVNNLDQLGPEIFKQYIMH